LDAKYGIWQESSGSSRIYHGSIIAWNGHGYTRSATKSDAELPDSHSCENKLALQAAAQEHRSSSGIPGQVQQQCGLSN